MNRRQGNHKKAIIMGSVSVLLIVIIVAFLARNAVGKQKNENTIQGTTTQTTTTQNTTTVPSTSGTTTKKEEDWRMYSINPKTITIDEEKWYLTLVNRYYKLPDDYAPKTAPAITGSKVLLDSRVAEQYQKMYDAGLKDGVTLTPYSGYRTISFQKEIYEQRIGMFEAQGYRGDEAKSRAAMVILPPGTSEHNMGLSMDIVSTKTAFEKTPEFAWLCKHAADYGFILRYPEDKTEVTKIVFEPWHWRYVGVKTAKEIKAKGVCLEEYLGKV